MHIQTPLNGHLALSRALGAADHLSCLVLRTRHSQCHLVNLTTTRRAANHVTVFDLKVLQVRQVQLPAACSLLELKPAPAMPGPDLARTENDDPATQKCGRCKMFLPLLQFLFKKKGPGAHHGRTKTCEGCAVIKKDWKDKRKAGKGKGSGVKGAEESGAESGNDEGAPSPEELDELTIDMFLQFLERQKPPYDIKARVSIPDTHGDRCKQADSLAEAIWEKLSYWFM